MSASSVQRRGSVFGVPLEGSGPVEYETRLREALANLGRESFGRFTIRVRKLTPHQIRDARLQVTTRALYCKLESTRGSGASTADSASVRAMMTKSRLPRSSATSRIALSLPIISSAG